MRSGKDYGERLRRDRTEIANYVAFEERMAADFALHVELTGRRVSEKARAVLDFLRERRFLERAGCVSLLLETHREWMRSGMDTAKERIFDSVEAGYERYYEVLKEGGYL